MGRRYSGHGAAAVGTDKTILNLFNTGTTLRGKLIRVIMGSPATPGDQAGKFYVGRTTGVGTEASGFTPFPLDPLDSASVYDFGVGHTVDPTYTAAAELLSFPLHQRATFQWYGDDAPFYLPATANAGAGLKSSSNTGTASHEGYILFEE